jgi:hypothetical protein
MPNGALPEADPSVRPAELRRAGSWLAGHGLVEARPTPLLAARLAARRHARRADSIVLAVLVLAAALVQANDRLAVTGHGGFGPHRRLSLLVLMALTVVLAVSALVAGDSIVRYAAVIVLVLLFGVTTGIAVQLRDLLARPVVAEDEVSLTADVIMRVEDARGLTSLWSVPLVLLFAATPGWWNVAAFILALVGSVMLVVIHKRTPPIGTVARQAMSAR